MKNLDYYLNLLKKSNNLVHEDINVIDADKYQPIVPKFKFSRNVAAYSVAALSLFVTALLVSIPFLSEDVNIVNENNDKSNLNQKLDYFNIKDINFIELNDDELDSIGIVKKDDTISFKIEMLIKKNSDYWNNGGYKSGKLPAAELSSLSKYWKNKGYNVDTNFLVKSSFRISYNYFNHYNHKYANWDNNAFNPYQPVIVSSTDKPGSNYSKKFYTTFINYASPFINGFENAVDSLVDNLFEYNTPKSVNDIPSLKRLIPVRILITKKLDNKTVETEIILWYVPTFDFVSKLPERYKYNIIKELNLIQQIEKKEITYKEACSKLNDENIVLLNCEGYHEDLTIKSIYPSPGIDDISLNFTNKKEQNLTIIIYDIHGLEKQKVCYDKWFGLGSHTINLNINEFENGIYIVAIFDKQGNTITSKFIKE